MRFSILGAVVSIVTGTAKWNVGDFQIDGEAGPRGQIQPRRFFQLQSFISHYTGADFDERKIWFYGCNCLMQNDRPMSSKGKGKPVDKLDRLCMDWKICQRCVQKNFGDQCIGELVEYDVKLRRGNPSCHANPLNSCSRALCECDNQFASSLPSKIKYYTDDYHLYWTPRTVNWDPESDCVKSDSKIQMKCCGGSDLPWYQYNADRQDCCHNGETAPKGECPLVEELSTTELIITTEEETQTIVASVTTSTTELVTTDWSTTTSTDWSTTSTQTTPSGLTTEEYANPYANGK